MVLFFGRLVKVVTKPGIHYYSFFGRSLIRVPTKTQTLDFKKTTVVDANGNPISVAGVVTYRFRETVKTAFDVIDPDGFVQRQALAVLKQVCSRYPYESQDGHSLQNEAVTVGRELCSLLQERTAISGAQIISYELADLQYAPEIAAGMLVRQQAAALISARKLVVEGAVSIVTSATEKLAEAGHELDRRERARLTSTLLAVICGEASVKPVYQVGESNAPEEQANNAVQEEILAQLKTLVAVSRAGRG
jgi:regulator of protease activity HflC (stomatin/prohibitin superfamily)